MEAMKGTARSLDYSLDVGFYVVSIYPKMVLLPTASHERKGSVAYAMLTWRGLTVLLP